MCRKLVFLFISLFLPRLLFGQVQLRTDTAVFEIDASGSLSKIVREGSGRQLIAAGQPSPLLQCRIDGRWHRPDRAQWNPSTSRLTLSFTTASAEAEIATTSRGTHLSLKVIKVRSTTGLPLGIELVLWGPYPTVIGETIGEIVGVVRDRLDAIGIQALNVKTLGGYPVRENDIEEEFGADDTGWYPDLPEALKKGQGFRGDTARPTSFGSVLQAFTRDRSRSRVISNWGHDHYVAPPYLDAGVVGSGIALFAGPESQALKTIGAIELAEGLPHPLIDGVWGKEARGATASYLIMDFSEANVERAIEMTRRAGLKYLYHSSPFASWGHFQLKPPLFPNGWTGFRICVEKARRAGIDIGFHTLSNFITPTDPYVTPVPDAGLAVIGSTELSGDIGSDTTEISLSDPYFFLKGSTLNTARIGEELIRFSTLTTAAPWRLLQCQRGAWGTRATAHSVGSTVDRLLDHPYKTFLADARLSIEIARKIADFCNRTGARQLSFDGLEGNWASGHGQYGRTLFTEAWERALDPDLRGTLINDASNPGHFNWHTNTRMNWGEPWYAGFRESQTLYRFKNQVLFERNFMPHMLGWFALGPTTSIEDAEWLLARAAGFDAGFALATSLSSTAQLAADPDSADTARQFGSTAAILARIGLWETARRAGAFPSEVRTLLRDNQREFHLSSVGEGAWNLQEASIARLTLTNGIEALLPGGFTHLAPTQPVQWTIHSTATTPQIGIQLEIDGHSLLPADALPLPSKGRLKFSGGKEAILIDATGRETGRIPVEILMLPPRGHPATVRLMGQVPAQAALTLELRVLGLPQRLQARPIPKFGSP